MASKATPIFASSFLRQSSLHGNIINNDAETTTKNKIHWFNTNNADCIDFPIRNTSLNKQEWLHLLSLISTRFIQVSWRILHDLQIAPPTNTNESVLVEISYNGNKTIACIQTIKQNNNFTLINNQSPLIRFSPLIISDLHLPHTFNPNTSSLLTLHKMNQIGLKSIDFHNIPIAKCIRFQLISSLSYPLDSSSTNYTDIVSKYMTENKVNGIDLTNSDYFVHHKCIWKGQCIAIPIIETNQSKSFPKLRGKAALKQFYKSKHSVTQLLGIKHWIYIKIVDILVDDKALKNTKYFRILPTVSEFIRIEQNANCKQPRLCEYFSDILLNEPTKNNSNNLFYHYQLPKFYENMLKNILFPNVCHHFEKNSKILQNIKVNPSFLMVSNNGHRLSANLDKMSKILGINYVYKNCIELLGPNMSATVELMQNFLHSALDFEPLLLCLDCLHLFEFEANIHSFYNSQGKIRPILPIIHVLQQFLSRNDTKKLILFGNTNDLSKITRELRAIFTYEHVIESIFDEKNECATEIIPSALQAHIADLNLINGLNTAQLFEIAHCANYQDAIDNIRHRQSLYNLNLNINVSSIPSIKWADVGGLESAKQQILDIVQLPLQYASIFSGIKQSIGILLYGPPGTGKTLLAKAIATEFSMNFISIKGPELLNPYVGQSEANIRNVFAKAIESRPCILFFDEIDALVPSRGKSSDGGNVMDRVVSQLLTQIDLICNKHNGQIFLIAATNRPDLLDAALLRPKRLDKQIYLGIATEASDKLKIIRALTRKFEFEEDKNVKKMDILREVVAKKEIAQFTGADLYALCCDAMMCSMKLLIEEIQSLADGNDKLSVDLLIEMIQNGKRQELENEYGLRITDEQWKRIKDFKVKLNLRHFEKALVDIQPSLSQKEILQYQSIHRTKSGY